jgi:uncharacterized membrane protein
MLKRLFYCIVFVIFLLQILSGVALAQVNYSERIIDFSSNIKVNQDASILVTEDITVYANGQTIRHGIYRDFPTIYKDELGNKYMIGFEVKDVKVNGLPETYVVSSLANGQRVKIGKADVLLNPGVYTYSITYQAMRELGFFPNHDELYWNVTGNGWNYNIEKVSATVTLPDGINQTDIKTLAYTGLSGSKDNNASTYILSDGKVNFVTAGTLAPYEGLTIAVSWPKGFVIAPTAGQIRSYWLQDNKGIIFGIVGFLITLMYFIFIWNKKGRDPKGRTIIAQYEPPKDISPAEARYLLNRYFDDRCLVADIIDLAVKGYIVIDKKISHYNLTLTNKKYETTVAKDSQKVLLELLFKKENVIDMGSYNSAVVDTKVGVLAWITENYKKNYFTLNLKYLVIGLILSALSIAVIATTEGAQTAGLIGFMSIWLSGWTVGVVVLINNDIKLWAKVFEPKRSWGSLPGAIFFSLFSVPFFVGEVFAVYSIYSAVSLWFILSLFSFFLNIIFYYLLKQYTETGLRIVEELKGFKLFLSVTEKDRMNFHNPPERTPELFEKYLPYALAMGVENKWAEQFADVFADKNMMNNHPLWYSSSMYSSSFVSGFVGGFSSSISSSTTPPGHSSGFGGGGGGGW